jgi:hypothetical protein
MGFGSHALVSELAFCQAVPEETLTLVGQRQLWRDCSAQGTMLPRLLAMDSGVHNDVGTLQWC